MEDKEILEIKQKFGIVCNLCGSEDVELDFCPGFVHNSGGNAGYISFRCLDCNSFVEMS